MTLISLLKFYMKKLVTGAASIVDGTPPMLFLATVSNRPFDSMTASSDFSVAGTKSHTKIMKGCQGISSQQAGHSNCMIH